MTMEVYNKKYIYIQEGQKPSLKLIQLGYTNRRVQWWEIRILK